MRLNLASDLKTRTGAPDKDARLKNCYVEMKGNDPAQAGVRKRPIAQGGVQVGSGIAQGGCGLVVVYGDTLYPIPIGTTCNGSTLYQVGDKVTVNFVDYWATTAHVGNCPTGPGNADWSTSFVPAIPTASPVGLGAVSMFFDAAGLLTAENAAGQTGQMQFTGYSNFGNPFQFGGVSPLTKRIAFTATRNLDGALVVLILTPGEFSYAASFGDLSIALEIVLDSTNFPLIGSGIKVASDIGGFSLIAGYIGFSGTGKIVVFGVHPTDGTTRYYAMDDNGAITYITDSTTIKTVWTLTTPRMTYVYDAGYLDAVNRTGLMNNVTGQDPIGGGTIITKTNVAYDSVYGWIALDRYGNMGAYIPISGVDWVVYIKGNFAYFVGTLNGTVEIVDFANFNSAWGGGTLTKVTAISGGGAYQDSWQDSSNNIYTSYSIAGDNYINSNGTITAAPNLPKLTSGNIARRKYSIRGTT